MNFLIFVVGGLLGAGVHAASTEKYKEPEELPIWLRWAIQDYTGGQAILVTQKQYLLNDDLQENVDYVIVVPVEFNTKNKS